MKPELQIKALAELDGYSIRKGEQVSERCTKWYLVYPNKTEFEFGWSPNYEVTFSDLQESHFPSYLTSRDAIVPVIQSQWWKGVLSFDAKFIEAMRIKSGRVSPLQILTAPASELREALLRATGKWVE